MAYGFWSSMVIPPSIRLIIIGCINHEINPQQWIDDHLRIWRSILGRFYVGKNDIWLVVEPNPSEKYESQIGSSSQLWGKIKNVPNHQ